MSILYVNSGYKSLLQDYNMDCYEGVDEQFAKCKNYLVPLDYKNWYTVYSNEKMKEWYVRFNIYTNLTNKPYNDYEGFLRISTLSKHLMLSIDSMGKLVLSVEIGDESTELVRLPFELDTINSYELHLYSRANDREIIELKCGEKVVYRNLANGIYNYFGHSEPYKVQIKNIVYLPNEENYRFGMALSNFIIGDTPIGDLVVQELKTNVTSNWNYSKGEYKATVDGKEIVQTIDDKNVLSDVKSNDSIICAVAIAAEHAKTDTKNTKLSFGVNDFNNNETFLTEDFDKGYESEIMEVNPIEGLFWDYDNIDKKFKIKSGGYT